MGSIHPMDGQHPQLSSIVHTIHDAGTLEYPDSIVLGNHEQSLMVQEISTNHLDYGESYD